VAVRARPLARLPDPAAHGRLGAGDSFADAALAR
jgi:hypothetical protein